MRILLINSQSLKSDKLSCSLQANIWRLVIFETKKNPFFVRFAALNFCSNPENVPLKNTESVLSLKSDHGKSQLRLKFDNTQSLLS